VRYSEFIHRAILSALDLPEGYQDAVADVPILQSPQGNRIPGISIPFTVPKAASADLSEIFDCIILVSYGNGRARVGDWSEF
jgi:hypothetical protein